MDEPLTTDELAALAAHGYTANGGGLSEDGTPFVRFRKDGRVHAGTRGDWRNVIAELTAPPTADVAAFGKDAWVYCSAHRKPHQTGWCTISPRDKIGLGVDTADAAYAKCRAWKFPIFGEKP